MKNAFYIPVPLVRTDRRYFINLVGQPTQPNEFKINGGRAADETGFEQDRIRPSFGKQGLMITLGATLESVSPGVVEIVLSPARVI